MLVGKVSVVEGAKSHAINEYRPSQFSAFMTRCGLIYPAWRENEIEELNPEVVTCKSCIKILRLAGELFDV